MIKKIICLLGVLWIALIARPIAFQWYIFDSTLQQPLSTDAIIPIESFFVDANGNAYVRTAQDQQISKGILHMSFDLDLSQPSQWMVFDQPGLKIQINLLDDQILLPLESIPLSIISTLSDRTVQINDPNLMHIQYDQGVVNMGGGACNGECFNH